MIKDPNAEREAQKYENPIASREVILALLDQSKGPLVHSQVAELLGISEPEQLEALRRRLNAMERDGQVVSNRKGAFGKVDKMNLVRGRVQGHREGYGFVIPADGSDDIYLSNRQMRRVFDGDEVLVRRDERGFRGRQEGAIVDVLVRNTKTLVGRFVEEQGVCLVRPDNPRIVQDLVIPADQANGAKPGQFVVVEIIEYPGRNVLPKGRVAEVLGEHLAPGMEIDVAIRNHSIPHEWPEAVTALAGTLTTEVAEKDKQGRFDLRDLPLVTIDGEDARDFDDAVYCERKKSGGWRLYVAIADVSHYVQVDDALDQEAIVRGNSVYFPDFVVPMLPEVLSNGLCSLNPHTDRLCMVCEMTISAQGKVSGYTFYEAVMHSKARLTYTQVGQILEEKGKKRSEIRQQFAEVVPHLDVLHELYQTLRKARTERGAIDFESQETRILFDEQRKIKQIVPTQRNDAHKVIEECMLAANVCSAKFLEQHEVPALYRVHDSPKQEKLELLRQYLAGLGLPVGLPKGKIVTPADYQNVLQAVAGRPDAHLIQTVMLRSMNQAVYQPANNGHFGLAYTAYTHFTSPIRRYPDLLVHRAIRSVFRSDMPSKRVKRHPSVKLQKHDKIYPYNINDMAGFGEQCSVTERRADEATRDVVSWLKCEYLQSRVGEEFDGVISSVVSFGLFVELKDLYVEGLVHITNLPQDYYNHVPAQHRLLGDRTGRVFSLGDELKVKVVRVNLDERKIDFEIVEAEGAGKRKPRKVKASGKAQAMAEEHEAKKKKSRRRKSGKKPAPAVEESKKAAAPKKTAKAKVTGAPTAAPKPKAKKPKKKKAAPGKSKTKTQ